MSNERLEFHQLLDNLPAAAYTCDTNGLITYFNKRAEQLWGRAPALNDSLDRFCGSFKLYSAEGTFVPHDQCWMALAIKEGRAFNGEEVMIERPDGVRLTVLAHANPLRNDAGEVTGAVNVVVDVTDRRQAMRAAELLAAIVKSSEDAIYSRNLEGTILSWNAGAERLYGYEAVEVIGKSMNLITPPEIQAADRELIDRICFYERVEHFESVRIHKDGRRIDVSLTMSPIHDAAGHIVGISKIARDITARKQADEAFLALKNELALQVAELRKQERRKNEFLATLSHELRNPLAPISNALHILRLSGDLPPAGERVREIMERQVNHLVRLVEDLLEVSRITRGKLELRKEQVALTGVIEIAVDTSHPLIEESRHQLAISMPAEVILLEADPVRLAQVISNLLNNAAKYTDPGGQIWLTTRLEGSEVVITVKDNGIGIPADMLPHVFDMFAQIDRTLKRSQGGLGIGLTLVKTLVQMHDGRIEARSGGPGQGSEFAVRLPALASNTVGQRKLPVAAPSSPPIELTSRKVLVVDDTRAAAYMLGRLLEALGQQVRTAESAATALDFVRLDRPDVIISDIGMPGMDGYEFARSLRQDPKLAGVVLVALTGYGQESDRQRAKEAGFDYHLVKPVSMEGLQALLGSLPVKSSDLPSGRLGKHNQNI